MTTRPQNKTIRSVVEYLESIGLSVYGQNVDLSESFGILYPSCKDYTAEDIILYRKHYETGNLVDSRYGDDC
jgi:hypothetical protein